MADVVNLPVVERPIPNVDIHAVLTVCGFTDADNCTEIINNEGPFQTLVYWMMTRTCWKW
jgi:hypothetical protein